MNRSEHTPEEDFGEVRTTSFGKKKPGASQEAILWGILILGE
jgi:hypothetical protein